MKICDFDLGSGIKLNSDSSPISTPELLTPVSVTFVLACFIFYLLALAADFTRPNVIKFKGETDWKLVVFAGCMDKAPSVPLLIWGYCFNAIGWLWVVSLMYLVLIGWL